MGESIIKKLKFLEVDDVFIYKVKLFNCINEDKEEQWILARCFDNAYDIAVNAYENDTWSIVSISESGYLDKLQPEILEQFERIK